MYKVITLDYTKCTGCRICEIVCSTKKVKASNPARSRIHVIRFDVDGTNVPMVCEHCDKAPCIDICPTNALSRDKNQGFTTIDYDKCIFCKFCVAVCPFGGMSIDYTEKRVIKCDLCQGDPICVKFCDPGALRFTEPNSTDPKISLISEKLSEALGGSISILS